MPSWESLNRKPNKPEKSAENISVLEAILKGFKERQKLQEPLKEAEEELPEEELVAEKSTKGKNEEKKEA